MILTDSKGAVFCSWCGNRITAHSWKAVAVRGYFCGKSCRDTAQLDEGYIKESPKGAK